MGPNLLSKDKSKIGTVQNDSVQRDHEMKISKPSLDGDLKVLPNGKLQNFNIKHPGASDTHGYLSTAQRYHNDINTFGRNKDDLQHLIETKHKTKLLQKQLKASNVCLSMRPSNYPF